ncbi:hypothetical protein GCM10010277_32600 [Streptomyces longisporoflavus]|uniref:hypothetical protein n=1 Tax=Streptomyces longisporoflavus TaxID=28044 RepID=UPI00167F06D4|nr:hypothetical protein [Streptomyces longisporoflavus]GGV43074.1 hypothetical protein GCM10010277_32600 [Streptomyces longisporoflavus]
MARGRSLVSLGLDVVPALQPLAYPGRPAPWPALLTGDELLPLGVRPLPLGRWTVAGQALDAVLGERGLAPVGRRHPVIAVGSNASPAQVAYKLVRRGIPAAVPMVPVRVRGIAVGCSAHIGRAGYVAAAPYRDDPAAETTLVVSWLDEDQFGAVDETEFPNYRRVLLPGDDFAMTLPSGEPLGGAFLYVSARGVLTVSGAGEPRRGGGHQATLLASLLAGSPRLRELLGPDPASWVRKAAADRAVRESGTRIFGEESWVLRRPGLLP